MGLLANIVKDNAFTPDDLPELERLFFEGPRRRVNLERFAILLFLSTWIATYGVLGDSTAVVIGAMIIAPLMKPIMATAAGLVMGDRRRAGHAFLTVVLGVAGTVFTAWFLSSFMYSNIISFNINSQIIGRISPSLTDLAVAMGAGAAAAFATIRSDVADSLPGVAISISLVPPLCVVGVGLSEGEWQVAYGAMLLFVTNFLSILLAGGGLLALLGLSKASTTGMSRPARRRAFAVIAAGMLVVVIPLAMTSYNVASETRASLKAQKLARFWLQKTDFELTRVDVDGRHVRIVITGPGDPPSLSDIDKDVKSLLEGAEVTIKIVPAQTLHYPDF